MFRRVSAIVLSALGLLACALPSVAAVAPLAVPNLQFGANSGGMRAIAALADGSVLVGGHFTEVNGLPRAGIAHILADGSVDLGWDAQLSQFADIFAIVVSGTDAYIGGIMSSAGGAARHALAKVSLATGAVSPWVNDVKFLGAQGWIFALAVDGTTVYFSGLLDEVAGAPRPQGIYRASLASSNSLDTTWGMAVEPLTDIAVDASWVYVSGPFFTIGGVEQASVARLSKGPGTAVDTAWRPAPDILVQRILLDASGVILGGRFMLVNGVPRKRLAEVDLATGAVTAWDPGESELEVLALARSGSFVYAGFGGGIVGVPTRTTVLRAPRTGAGTPDESFRLFTGESNPSIETVLLAPDGKTYIGGAFEGVNGFPISHLARLNADGTLDSAWRPDPDGDVLALASLGSDLLVGGRFERIGGLARKRAAKVSTGATAIVDPSWNPDANGAVTGIAVDGTDVYLAGEFLQVSGLDRYAVAKVAAAGNGAAVPAWNAGWQSSSGARTILASAGALYAGGFFAYGVGNTQFLVKLSAADGSRITSWAPSPNSTVEALALEGSQLYVAGWFRRIGGVQQSFLARLDADSGAVDESWIPVPANILQTFAVRNGVVYVPTSAVNNVFIGSNAAISTATGRVDFAWTTDPTQVYAMNARADQVWLGMGGTGAGRQGVAAFPEAFCASQPDGTACNAGASYPGATCQASICSPALGSTATSVSVSPPRTAYGRPVTLTATVTSGAGTPFGRVTFYGADGFEIGAAAVVSGTGSATLNAYENVSRVVAVFEGSTGYAPSRSAPTFPTISQASRPHSWDGDNRPDLVYRNTASGATYIWHMSGTTLDHDQYVTTIDQSWSLVGHGDFNGDGRNDMVWRNDTTGTAYVWYMVDGVFQSDAFLFTIDPAWKIEAVADFDRDGKPDFFFRNQSSGVGFIWYFNNTAPVSDQFLFSIDNSWIVENVGDFNNDGYPDFFFRNTSSGVGFVWYWNGSSLGASNYMFSIEPQWEVVQVADWNLDNHVDLVFRNRETGVTFVWYTDGTTLQGSDYLFQVDPAWKIVPSH